jgi:general secretion pathway protein A
MYESFYGLKEKPFKILPDPGYLYMSKGHENAYTHLEYAIAENKGFVVITGEIGSGKTTLINYLLGKIQEDIKVGVVNNTYVPPTQFLRMICQEFELIDENLDKSGMLHLLQAFLIRQFADRKRVVLIIDEAQNLTSKTMEEVRMLSNLEDEKHHLIQMILVGQPELKSKLQRRDLVQFAQRVTVHCHLNGLNSDEVKEYILYRLKVAGANRMDIFTDEAIEVICQYSNGIPRLINILCDTALVYGYADNLQVIEKDTIENVIKERESTGVFSAISQEKIDGTSFLDSNSAGVPSAFQSQFELMSKRVETLEDRLKDIDKEIKRVLNYRDERDAIVVELFKMLKKNMEDRLNTLLDFVRFKKEMKHVQIDRSNNDQAEQAMRFSMTGKSSQK